ncbi:MAG: S8 family serine peptidase, partial [Caulobacterales bacterium]|nr:S8 family serine peptidase [Caulobacterales bacterium]
MARFSTLTSLALACGLLAACGGGGGGSSGPVNPTPPTPPTTPTDPRSVTNPSLPLNPPSVSSDEYRRNYALAAVRADAPYALGATGKGVTVAIIDTGFATQAPDMQGAYSAASKDLYASRNQLGGVDSHGARVAGVLASRFNGQGTIGAAYESTVLGIRADNTVGPSCTNSCTFTMHDLATAIDYAVANGARVVNMSLADVRTDPTQSAEFEAALTRAINAGVVFTVAAGNSGEADPAAHARYAVDSRFLGAFLAIGAMAPDNGMAGFSNRAGVTAAGYIAAPGQDVITDCDSAGNCASASGTSFASPIVAGGVAMLLQYFPNLSGRDAVSILLKTADDRGEAGVDSVWGNGALNLAKAFAPVGSQTLALPGGASLDLPAASTPGTMLGAAFGDAVLSSAGLTTVIHDDYNRLFSVDLAQGYR